MQVCGLNWSKFQDQVKLVLDQEKSPDDTAYSVHYGINEKSGMPCWCVDNFQQNSEAFRSPKQVQQSYLYKRDILPTGVIHHPENHGYYTFDFSFLDIYKECGTLTDPKKVYNAMRDYHADKCEKESNRLLVLGEKSQIFMFKLS